MAQAAVAQRPVRTRLNRQQIGGFWAAWLGNTLDGTDISIAGIALAPALLTLLPLSGMPSDAGTVGYLASVMLGLYLVGWSLSFLAGPLVDRFGRTRMLAVCCATYAIFTATGGLAQNIWQLGVTRFLAGLALGGEWAAASTYVAEIWPEDRRKMGAGYLHTGIYFGSLLAGVISYFVSPRFGWRGLFLCGLAPVLMAVVTLAGVREPERWKGKARAEPARRVNPVRAIFGAQYLRTTMVMAALMTVASTGLWGGSQYFATAVTLMAREQGLTAARGSELAAYISVIVSAGTILGCVLAPMLAERVGRKRALATYFAVMLVMIVITWGWIFYRPPSEGLRLFFGASFVIGMAQGYFALFTLWLPELYGTLVRGTGFAFCTTSCRFLGAGVNFAVGAASKAMGTLGTPLACIAVVFAIGLLIIPLARETRGQPLPD